MFDVVQGPGRGQTFATRRRRNRKRTSCWNGTDCEREKEARGNGGLSESSRRESISKKVASFIPKETVDSERSFVNTVHSIRRIGSLDYPTLRLLVLSPSDS